MLTHKSKYLKWPACAFSAFYILALTPRWLITLIPFMSLPLKAWTWHLCYGSSLVHRKCMTFIITIAPRWLITLITFMDLPFKPATLHHCCRSPLGHHFNHFMGLPLKSGTLHHCYHSTLVHRKCMILYHNYRSQLAHHFYGSSVSIRNITLFAVIPRWLIVLLSHWLPLLTERPKYPITPYLTTDILLPSHHFLFFRSRGHFWRPNFGF